MPVISVAVVIVLLIVAAGAFIVIGSSYASARVANADSAVTAIERIDFTTQIFQVGGGYDIVSGTIAPHAFQTSVTTFVTTVKSDSDAIDGDRSKIRSARNQLGSNSWLTALQSADISAARGQLDRAAIALDEAGTITAGLIQDGQFFQAYAQALIDFQGVSTAQTSGDITGSYGKLELLKTDLAKAAPLAGSTGLPSGVRQFVAAFQSYVSDFIALQNAALTNDKTAYDAALTKVTADIAAVKAIDPTSLDTGFQEFYQPMIARYNQDLRKAAG